MAIVKQRPPEERDVAPAPRDHNKPPLEDLIPLEFREKLLEDRPDFLRLMDDYLGSIGEDGECAPGVVDRVVVTDEDTLGRAGKVINALRAMEKHVSETHVAVKAPYLLGSKLCDAEKNALVGRITTGRVQVQSLMDAYSAEQLRLRREEERRRAEEARQAAEERAKLEQLAKANNIAPSALPPLEPLAPPPMRAEPVRTDGATVSFMTEWDCTVFDHKKAFAKVKDDAAVREAIEKAVRRIVKSTKGQVAIPGVEIFERAKAAAR